MTKNGESKEEIRDLLRTVRREVQKFSKDMTTASQRVVESTQKVVRDVSPKVTATIDETMRDTSEVFRRAMGSIDKQTRSQQVKLLRTYKAVLARQAEVVEKRLRKLSK